MRDFEHTGSMRLTNAQREGAAKLFTSARADGAAMARSLRWAHDRAGQVIDPHTAVGLHAALECDLDRSIPIVTLATAHPAKFADAVERATGVRPALPMRVGDIFAREEAGSQLSGSYERSEERRVGKEGVSTC